MYGWGDHIGAWGWVLMTLSWIAFWALVILGLIAVIRYLRGTSAGRNERPSQSPGRPTPEQLLAERYARGEIDETEYRRRLDILTETRS